MLVSLHISDYDSIYNEIFNLHKQAAVLAPPGYGAFAAWFTGWSNWLGQVTGAPSGKHKVTLEGITSP